MPEYSQKQTTPENIQQSLKNKNVLKYLKFVRVVQYLIIFYFAIMHLVIMGMYLMSKVSYYGHLARGYFNSFKAVICLVVIFSEFIYSKCARNQNMTTTIVQIVFNFIFIILLVLDVVFFMQQFQNIDYGPLTIINENQTQIHWYTKKRTTSMVTVDDVIYSDDSKSNYHNVLINRTDFNFQITDISAQTYNYSLPQTISKFVVMTDIHSNGHYIEQMSSDYDFALFCGDYSYGGMAHEFSKTFKKSHNKPLILAAGNHDSLGQINSLITRPTNFYQKIGQNGFYFLYVLSPDMSHHSHVDNSRAEEAILFLNNNLHLSENDSNVFIVSHQAIYSTGEFGSIKYFTVLMEKFIQEHPNARIRATFSGHDHVFASFYKYNTFFFVNGAGGGPLDPVFEWGERSWTGTEMSGPLQVINDRTLGYESHIQSYQKYTRTEVEIEQGKIKYVVRDLDTGAVLTTFEQKTE
ncbi:Alkaline_phosphatase [Hexamita inflata]|uniref:Alkaline phosphatase n=1 Tax=Hexamita inflata TaxID=28002 RepID=A0AA86UTW3_9EUKA|nr:Alkaline phosphatase [Hexamita inflata]CAI9964436.1 Alkaline phosphatase [Hexamita inflata]